MNEYNFKHSIPLWIGKRRVQETEAAATFWVLRVTATALLWKAGVHLREQREQSAEWLRPNGNGTPPEEEYLFPGAECEMKAGSGQKQVLWCSLCSNSRKRARFLGVRFAESRCTFLVEWANADGKHTSRCCSVSDDADADRERRRPAERRALCTWSALTAALFQWLFIFIIGI